VAPLTLERTNPDPCLGADFGAQAAEFGEYVSRVLICRFRERHERSMSDSIRWVT
jgi:hypothetical protein